ncbi:mRNA splicing protein, variant 2 [Ascochyta rabiei]|uniref:mRNA splicing protein, variant 2 n=1 Tax=Didymella rabiei TaxID=5454 RepID=UPI00220E160D|nr:mRNA splicing protein, variant 2 [Ascochyta rabiei]UPX17376.1 mRNA splicing protein, variant 2 [Ascochyta rabiei]
MRLTKGRTSVFASRLADFNFLPDACNRRKRLHPRALPWYPAPIQLVSPSRAVCASRALGSESLRHLGDQQPSCSPRAEAATAPANPTLSFGRRTTPCTPPPLQPSQAVEKMVDAKIQCVPPPSPLTPHALTRHRELLSKPRSELTYVCPAPQRRVQGDTDSPAVSTKCPRSKSTSSPPVLSPSSRPPSARAHKSSSPAETTERSLPVSRPSTATATWSSKTQRKCGRRPRG